MIIGYRLMAMACRQIDSEDVLFFASGVSDSSETDSRAFKREEDLLRINIGKHYDKVFVYFGAIGGGKEYLKHKDNMKSIVKSEAERHVILNLSQVVGWGGNNNNLFNSFRSLLINGEEIRCYRNCLRSMIDIEDVIYVLNYLISIRRYGA